MSAPLRSMALLAALLLAGCPAPRGGGGGGGGDGGVSSDNDCADCLTDKDCTEGRLCVQVGSGSGCLKPCENGFCEGGEKCFIAPDNAGLQQEVCAGTEDTCVTASSFDCSTCPAGTECNKAEGRCDPLADGGSSGGGQTCGTLVSPDTNGACCTSCGSHTDCQHNGCYGGWWCDTATCKCHSPPTTCGGGGGGTDGGSGGGGGGTGWDGQPVTGTVGNSGGQVSRLYFAVVGDTRPANADQTSSYPTAIIQRIYGDITALSPRPSFGLSTGDYMYATPGRGTALPQLQLYEQAQQQFPNPVFHAMGNHECTGFTASECGPGTRDGSTENYNAFMQEWVTPLGQSHPYYALSFTTPDGSWTAKIVLVAANAWTSAQSSWLDTELATPTTFTFVVRHEPWDDTKCPGTQASETIIRRHPLTLEITGHTHTFYVDRSVSGAIVGNGGAPMTGSADYGYATVSQISASQVVLSEYDYSSGGPSRTWTVDANGTVH